jgi:hypothetical protein
MEQPPFWGITSPGVQARRSGGGLPVLSVALGLVVLLVGAAAGAALVGRLLRQPEQIVHTRAVRDHAPQAAARPPATAAGTPTPAGSTRRIVPAGHTALDGGLAFKVGSAVCGGGSDDAAGAAADGGAGKVFCVVELRISNVAGQPRTLDPSSQYAFDQRGRRHQPSSATAGAANAGTSLGNLAPGASVTGTIIYEVAAGTSLHHLELHAARGSAGVRLAV